MDKKGIFVCGLEGIWSKKKDGTQTPKTKQARK